MQLIPEFLPVGSIVEYNIMIHNRWMPVRLNATDILQCESDSKHFNKFHRPILLTEKILTEWCGFEKIGNDEFVFKDEESRMVLEFTELYIKGGRGVLYSNYPVLEPHTCIANIEHLHQLQHLYSALTQTVLPIKIK